MVLVTCTVLFSRIYRCSQQKSSPGGEGGICGRLTVHCRV